jgi:hypothetical protein
MGIIFENTDALYLLHPLTILQKYYTLFKSVGLVIIIFK